NHDLSLPPREVGTVDCICTALQSVEGLDVRDAVSSRAALRHHSVWRAFPQSTFRPGCAHRRAGCIMFCCLFWTESGGRLRPMATRSPDMDSENFRGSPGRHSGAEHG